MLSEQPKGGAKGRGGGRGRTHGGVFRAALRRPSESDRKGECSELLLLSTRNLLDGADSRRRVEKLSSRCHVRGERSFLLLPENVDDPGV